MTQISPLRERVALARFRRGITLRTVAKEINVSYPYLRQFMCGVNESEMVRNALEQWVDRNQ